MRHVVVVELFLFEPLVISAYYGLTMGTGSVPNPARFPPLILTKIATHQTSLCFLPFAQTAIFHQRSEHAFQSLVSERLLIEISRRLSRSDCVFDLPRSLLYSHPKSIPSIDIHLCQLKQITFGDSGFTILLAPAN